MQKYDAVVIGAGNGGLAAACRMAKGGKRRFLSSGTTFRVAALRASAGDAFEFETALHEICEWGSKENPGGCRKTCEEFGLDIPWHMVPDNFRVITTASDGKTHIDATLPCTVKEFVNEMERLVPGCRKSIQDLFLISAPSSTRRATIRSASRERLTRNTCRSTSPTSCVSAATR